MSLWLSKIVVAEVLCRLAEGPKGAVATADAPRIHKAIQDKHPNLEVWSSDSLELAAVVVGNLGQGQDWETRAEAWRRSLASGGMLVSVDKGPAAEVSRRMLCSGFSNLTQVRVGRRLVTCGNLVPVPDDRLC